MSALQNHPFRPKLSMSVARVRDLARRFGVAKSSVSAIVHLHVCVPEHVVTVPLAKLERALLAEIARDQKIPEEQLASELLARHCSATTRSDLNNFPLNVGH